MAKSYKLLLFTCVDFPSAIDVDVDDSDEKPC